MASSHKKQGEINCLSKMRRKIKNFLRIFTGKYKTVANISYLQPNTKLNNKRIIVTGGGRGLGAAMAEKFVAEGAKVLITGRNEETLKKTAEKLACKFLVLDVNNVSEYDKFMDEAIHLLGYVDVLVNNAGISLHEKSFFDVTPETFDAQMNTNFKSGFFLSQRLIDYWIKEKISGNILFVSSEAGETDDFRPYGFTKAAINSMVRGLAYLFAEQGIRINAVAPGVTCSDMTGHSPNGNLYYPENMLDRLYLPNEVAETATFLISDVAGCISGQVVACNNGRSINARWKR